MSKRSVVCRLLLASVLAVLPVSAFATSQLFVASSGDGVFVVTGRFENVGGIQLNLSYDPTTLSNPRVSLGDLIKGMTNISKYSTNPIVIAGVGTRLINGSGTVAIITFDKVGDSLGVITGLTGLLIDTGSRPVAMLPAQILNPSAVADKSGTSGDGTTAGSGNGNITTADTGGGDKTLGGSTPTVVGGTVVTPGDPLAGGERRDDSGKVAQDAAEHQAATESAPQQTAPQQTAPQPSEPQAPATQQKKAVAQATAAEPLQSVLDKFKLFSGDRTVGNLTALFDASSATFAQTPAVAISDGQSTVKLNISNVPADQTPTFSFNFARSVAVHKVGEGEWEVIVKPQEGTVKASVVMNVDGTSVEIPLTVAPKVETALTRTGSPEADFQLFLNDRGTASAPKHDLNGDGKRDYLDDYIYTANYLVNTSGAAPATAQGTADKVTAEQKQ